jgi:peptidoglycan/LPS O-acetylase OafA/YrhL
MFLFKAVLEPCTKTQYDTKIHNPCPTPTMSDSQRDNNFDLLRLIFAYVVVFAHTRELSGGFSDLFLFHSQGWGVDGFFLLSGFLVFRSWQNQPCFPSYFLRRFFRVYPAYITVVLLQCCIMVALQWRETTLSEIAQYLAANAVFLNFLKPAIGDLFSGLPFNAVNGALWTLKVEVTFYAILPIAVIAARKHLPIILALAGLASFIYVFILLDYEQVRLANQFPGKIRLFVIGILLAIYKERIPIWAYGAAVAAAIGVLLAGLDANNALNLFAKDVLLASGIMIAAFLIPRVRISRDISFTVYLTHFPLIQFAVIAGLHSVVPFAAFLTIILVANTALALLLSVCIEKPLLSYGARLAASYKAREMDFSARTYNN